MEEDSLYLHLHQLSSVSTDATAAVDHVLETLWKTRRTGLGADQKSSIQSLLNLPTIQELDPVLACIRSLIRKCVRDDLAGEDIRKLFPLDLPLELQSTLVMLLQKHQNQWKEEAARDQPAWQRSRASQQFKISAPPMPAPYLASEISSSMWPRQDNSVHSFNCGSHGNLAPNAADLDTSSIAPASLHRDDGPPDNLAVLPRLKSMTWTMENRRATPANRVAVITLKLQDFSKTPSGERDVKFQLSRDTLEAMLRSMAYISEQLSNAAGLLAGPVQQPQQQ